jgi:hypothetical protein
MNAASGLENQQQMNWEGPLRIGEVATNTLRPPEGPGLYIISKEKWSERPDSAAHVIYVGQAGILRRRAGELVAALLGFSPSGDNRYLHGKGRRIFHELCNSSVAEGAKLFVGWVPLKSGDCIDYEEAKLFRTFHGGGELMFKKVPNCNNRKHRHQPLGAIG